MFVANTLLHSNTEEPQLPKYHSLHWHCLLMSRHLAVFGEGSSLENYTFLEYKLLQSIAISFTGGVFTPILRCNNIVPQILVYFGPGFKAEESVSSKAGRVDS